MNVSASTNIAATDCRLARATRSSKRQAIQYLQKEEQRLKKKQELATKAHALMATPLLRALPLALSQSGFLYKVECRNAALVCKDWQAIVAEFHEEIAENCQVQIIVPTRDRWPEWVTRRDLQNDIVSQAFGKAIFEELCNLKVSAETTERKKQTVRRSLPIWGRDFLSIHIHPWDRNARNSGGLYISFLKFGCNTPYLSQADKLGGWTIRLDKNLSLWTWDGPRKWKKTYAGRPLWFCQAIQDEIMHETTFEIVFGEMLGEQDEVVLFMMGGA